MKAALNVKRSFFEQYSNNIHLMRLCTGHAAVGGKVIISTGFLSQPFKVSVVCSGELLIQAKHVLSTENCFVKV